MKLCRPYQGFYKPHFMVSFTFLQVGLFVYLIFSTKPVYEKRATIIGRPLALRCVAESNRLEWFCRPVPNRSDNAPFLICVCKGTNIISFHQTFSQLFFNSQGS